MDKIRTLDHNKAIFDAFMQLSGHAIWDVE